MAFLAKISLLTVFLAKFDDVNTSTCRAVSYGDNRFIINVFKIEFVEDKVYWRDPQRDSMNLEN